MSAAGFWKPPEVQVVGIPPETRMQINGPVSKVWEFLIAFRLLLIIPNYQKTIIVDPCIINQAPCMTFFVFTPTQGNDPI